MRSTNIYEDLSNAIKSTLKYFHIFRHPLYADEIQRFLSLKVDKQLLSEILEQMVVDKSVYKHMDMYMLEDNIHFAEKRLAGGIMAEKLMIKAERSAAIISQFPFVRAVCISGSLSKGYADERSDIDLFIITGKNRLWTCRTILHFYKKLTFLFGRQHSFCMNYFLDESHMLLEENNVFTATELTTLVPVFGKGCYSDFIAGNTKWLSVQFPNVLSFSRDCLIANEKNTMQKRGAEMLLNVMFPQAVNKAFMKLTDSWWRYKWQKKNYPMQDYDLAMKTKLYVSKNHPANYQKKVLNNVNSPQVVKPVLQPVG